MHSIYLSLGSNLGERLENLRQAISALAQHMALEAISPIYETEPMYVKEQPRFLNLACGGTTGLAVHELLAATKKLERDLGRGRTVRYGPRPVDIDLLFYDDCRISTPDLTVPHPLLAERAFVLVPLGDIAPDLIHPGLQLSIAELKRRLGDTSKEVRLAEEQL